MYSTFIYKKVVVFLLLMTLIGSVSAQTYTAGNIVALEIGNGAAGNPNLGGVAYTEVIVEFKPAGGAAQSATVVPFTTAGARCTDGTQASDGDLNLSGDGRFITFTGYDVVAGAALSVGTANVNRMITMVNNARTVTFPAYYSSVSPNGCYQTNNIRAAVTNDGTSFWAAGSGTNGGVNNIPSGLVAGTTANGVAAINVTSTRTVKIFNNQLYGNANSGADLNPFAIGSGMPSAGPQAFALLGASGSINGYSFVLFDRDRNGSPDLLYVADANGGSAGLYKYYLNGATWAYAGRLLTGTSLFGVTGYLDCSNNPVLYMTTLENGTNTSGAVNKIYTYTDASATNSSAFAGVATVFESAGTGYIYKGIAMAPTQGDLTVGASINAAGSYRRIIVNSGTLTLTANISVSDSIYVANGATLDCGAFTVSGRSFVLGAGGTLKIGDPNGITASAPSGNIQTSCRNYNSLGNYVYEGAAAQVTGDGLPYTIHNLTMNNSSTGVTLTDSVFITNLFTLTLGVLYTSDTTLLIIGPSPAAAAGGSNTTYVDGPMKKMGNTSFVFRLGNNGYYATLNMSAPPVITDNFIAQYFNTSPDPTYSISSIAPSIDHVSNCEYWSFYNSGGSSTVNVTLSWNTPRSCGITALTDLLVAQWDGAVWQDMGRLATIGNTVAGAVISATQPPSFSPTMPFTLGSISGNNPLPIELLTFDAVYNGTDVTINWTTASEKNNDYFNIERSADAADFTSIAKVNGAGNSTSTISYADADKSPLAGISYYRLKQTDYDGNTSYSDIRTVNIAGTAKYTVFPNPASDEITVSAYSNSNASAKLITTIKVYNTLGEVVINNPSENATSPSSILNIQQLPSGIYYIELNNEDGPYRTMFIKK